MYKGTEVIKEMISLGMKKKDIQKRCRIGDRRFNAIFKYHMKYTLISTTGVVFGSKTVPYHDCEDMYGVVPSYSYNELSLNEKEFYESKN